MPTVSLCMIVKEEDERFLQNCLRNVREHVDQVVCVVDRKEPFEQLARELKLTLVERVFKDFASQRNLSLWAATKEWILVLDADEVIAGEDVERLKALAVAPTIAVEIVQLNYTHDRNQERFLSIENEVTKLYGFPGYFPVPTIRFFKNGEGFRFSRKVHEMVDESIASQGKSNLIKHSEIQLHHLKHVKGPELTKKTELRYLSFLEEEVKEQPNRAKTWFDIGTTYLFTVNDPTKAKEALKKALELGFSHAKKNLAVAHGLLGEWGQALAVYETMEHDASALINQATCFFHLKRYDSAITCLNKAQRLAPERREELEKNIALVREHAFKSQSKGENHG